MPVPPKSQVEELDVAVAEERLRPAPTLYLIIAFKLAKGVLFLAAGILLYLHAANGLSAEYQRLMHAPSVEWVFRILRIHPENEFFVNLALKIENLTEASVRNAAVGTVIWSLFPLVEGFGMMFRVSWAGWLAIGESAFFVPIEFFELSKKFSLPLLVLTVSNVLYRLVSLRQPPASLPPSPRRLNGGGRRARAGRPTYRVRVIEEAVLLFPATTARVGCAASIGSSQAATRSAAWPEPAAQACSRAGSARLPGASWDIVHGRKNDSAMLDVGAAGSLMPGAGCGKPPGNAGEGGICVAPEPANRPCQAGRGRADRARRRRSADCRWTN